MNGTVGYAQKSPVYSFLPYNYWNIKSDYKSQIKNQVRICTCLSKVKLLIIYLQCIVMELHRKFYINLPSQIKKTWKTKRKQSGDRITDKLIRTIQPPPLLKCIYCTENRLLAYNIRTQFKENFMFFFIIFAS